MTDSETHVLNRFVAISHDFNEYAATEYPNQQAYRIGPSTSCLQKLLASFQPKSELMESNIRRIILFANFSLMNFQKYGECNIQDLSIRKEDTQIKLYYKNELKLSSFKTTDSTFFDYGVISHLDTATTPFMLQYLPNAAPFLRQPQIGAQDMEELLIVKDKKIIQTFRAMPKPLFLEWMCSDELSQDGFEASFDLWAKYRRNEISVRELAGALEVNPAQIEELLLPYLLF